MSLVDDARRHVREILKSPLGPSWPFSLTSPLGTVYELVGQFNDVHLEFDTDTQTPVSERQITVTFVTTDVAEKVVSIDGTAPWRVVLNGETYRVRDTYPDRLQQLTVCILERYY